MGRPRIEIRVTPIVLTPPWYTWWQRLLARLRYGGVERASAPTDLAEPPRVRVRSAQKGGGS